MPSLINLDGQFKVDIYNQQDALIESTDYFSNFITTTGLSYPFVMPFAETFKWLSLGEGNAPNTINTTGLHTWFDATDYNEDYSDAFSYTTGFVADGCGFKEHLSGVDLFRAWRIPEREGKYIKKNGGLTIKEFMVSPGRFEKLGAMNDSDYLWTGTAGSALPETHTSGLSAFSRVVREMTIPSGDYAVITYKLGINLDHKVKDFSKFITLEQADQTEKNGTNFSGPLLFQELTGQARILHAGVRVVLGSEHEGTLGKSEGGGEDSKPGDTILVDNVGDPMEPCQSGAALGAYFSTDNTQWMFDPYLGGKVETGAFKPWNTESGANLATGFPEFFHNIYTHAAKASSNAGGGGGGAGGDDRPESLKHLIEHDERLGRFKEYFRTEKSELPTPGDYTKEAGGGALGNLGYSWNGTVITSDEHETTVFSDAEDFDIRTRSIRRTCSWQPKNAQQDSVQPPGGGNPYWIRYRALVFGFRGDSSADKDFIPFFDSLFATHNAGGTCDPVASPNTKEQCATEQGTWTSYGGNEFLPYQAYEILSPPDSNYTYTGTTGYYPFNDGNNTTTVSWKLTWSAPCGEVTVDCTNP